MVRFKKEIAALDRAATGLTDAPRAPARAKFADGTELYAVRSLVGTDVEIGGRVRVIESYAEHGAEPFYLVRTDGGKKIYAHESDLSVRDPLLA